MDTVGLHHVEQSLLTHAILLLEEFMFWICSGDVSSDHLTQERCWQQLNGVSHNVSTPSVIYI